MTAFSWCVHGLRQTQDGSVGAALGTGEANATQYPSVATSRTTPDGWTLGVGLSAYAVHEVPVLDQSPFTREAFIDLNSNGVIGGHGRVPVDAGTLTYGLQLACGIDVSNGMQLGLALSPSVGVTISYPPALTANVGITPSVSATVKPGVINDFKFGTKTLKGSQAGMQMIGVHIVISGCLSGISIRPYASVAISTRVNDTTTNVYGKPVTL
ncbi:MspA family porin [Jongsikchunia kroppenstedtii]|uniref:MspA family porin n=1 Tax=Jongsikchunia kroppenstedtii TaxID=1121721 RepID=UPI00037B6E67|nr:MspA family porin [Jongsikchunia kroppenstedtii]